MEKNISKLTGIALATAVAGMFTLSSATAFAAGMHSDEGGMKCEHSSSCKGQGACKSSANSCKGQNACKGQGFTMQKDKAACEAAEKEAKAS